MNERNLTVPKAPTISTEPVRESVVIRQIHIVTAVDPNEYMEYLSTLTAVDEKYPQEGKAMSGKLVVRAAIEKGGQGQTFDVNMIVPIAEGPFRTKSEGVGVGRPVVEEIILVKPDLPASLDERSCF